MPMIRSSITKFLTSPSKVARALDWKKSASVLSLHVGKDSIDMAVTSHPSTTSDKELILPLPSIPIKCEVQHNQKVLKEAVLNELASIVEQFDVCGMVVSWPVQKEGWCGAPCGKVLHTLDQMARDKDIVSASRPVCLWDGHHFHSNEDEWGRSALYAHISKKDIHIASKEQYKDEGSLAAEIAHDYLRHHWPDLYDDERPEWAGKTEASTIDISWLDAYEDTASYSKASL
mmetsp:Transcript_17384/g.32998  ORF Transcript_17384/g.32998 Transcript_17384/m.32998 type:complete len:231 (-) Transcript_17384:120-812(-)